MRNILERIEIAILRRYLDGAAPATGAEEVMAVRIGNLGSINFDGVVVKTFIQVACVTVPGAILSLGELAAVSKSAAHAFGFRRDDSELQAALRVVLWKLFARLIRGAGLPVINRRFFFGRTKRAAQN